MDQLAKLDHIKSGLKDNGCNSGNLDISSPELVITFKSNQFDKFIIQKNENAVNDYH